MKDVVIMDIVKEGDKVQLLCELKLTDGTTCYKNEQDKPIEVTIGDGKFFPVIENELKNMKKGETKEVTLEPKDAFGMHNKELVAIVPKNNVVDGAKMKIGSRIQMKTKSDKIIQGFVTDIKDDTYTVDFNHPLAGKNIVFTITIKSIEKS
jgi:FKBP-type peptidyl-prolyl cis-trans isomerase 2